MRRIAVVGVALAGLTFGPVAADRAWPQEPGPDDAQWMQVPWMPSSNIYAARKKAAEEGKPLLLWYMAGEPLGTC